MELIESRLQDQDICNFIPRGGPIYVPDFPSPITRVTEFEISIVEELKSLEAELNVDMPQPCDDDLLVDELKIFTEDELIDKAFKEAFKDDEDAEILSQHSEVQCNEVSVNQRDNRSFGNGHWNFAVYCLIMEDISGKSKVLVRNVMKTEAEIAILTLAF